MNCEKGELAVIVKATRSPEHLGKIVTIAATGHDNEGNFGYFTQEPLFRANGEQIYGWKAKCMRPIRDNLGTDETLLWAPVPSKVKEKA